MARTTCCSATRWSAATNDSCRTGSRSCCGACGPGGGTPGRARLFLNGSAHGSQMITESQGRRLLALRQVGVEPHLTAQGDTGTDPFGLASLRVADRLRKREDVHSSGGLHKEHTIVIAKDQILPTHCPISHRGGLQRILGTDIEALRASWDRSEAEDRQSNRLY